MQRLRITMTAAALALVATTALTGCSLINNFIGPGDAVRDEDGQVTDASDVDAFSITVGDCFNDETGAGEEFSSVPVVPCSEPHDNEIFHEFDLPEGAYPGDSEIGTLADEGCLEPFGDFVGLDYADSNLDYFTLTPTSEGWDGGDHLIQCTIYDPVGQVTGTLEGASY